MFCWFQNVQQGENKMYNNTKGLTVLTMIILIICIVFGSDCENEISQETTQETKIEGSDKYVRERFCGTFIEEEIVEKINVLIVKNKLVCSSCGEPLKNVTREDHFMGRGITCSMNENHISGFKIEIQTLNGIKVPILKNLVNDNTFNPLDEIPNTKKE